MTDPLATIRRRLERFELEHLRTHSAELAARIEILLAENEALREEVDRAWSQADMWHDRVDGLIQSITDADMQVGMTKDGEIGVVA